MTTIQLKTVEPHNPDLQYLIKKLDEDLMQRYPAEEIFGINFEDPKINEIVFVVAYSDELPVGCGAIRPIDEDTTELKRFFVASDSRQQGIAKQILNRLETKSKELNFKTIKLEAGTNQPETLSFYKKHGYYEIDRFGDYIDCESSLCFEKHLA